jgi:hypothetical protein
LGWQRKGIGLFQELQAMRKHLIAAGVAAAAFIPTFAFAQQSCEEQRSNSVVGTVAGAGIGALLGNAIAGRGSRTEGTIIGGVGGAVVGNQLSRPSADCAHAYGYYDRGGAWHASAVARGQAIGYYDRTGAWVEGAPNGYYDGQGRWIAASVSVGTSGYYDAQGRWVPASAGGYYDSNGQFVTGSVSGYYDDRGRWIAGPAIGRYDDNGRWIPGQPNGHRDANGVWIADAQTGYYDANGRWRAGRVMGYYDAQGRWFATGQAAAVPATYQTRADWAGAPADIRSRVAWLDQRIRRGSDDGRLRRNEADRALRSLDEIRQQEIAMSHYRGELNDRDAVQIQARLDDLSSNIRWTPRDDRRRD